MLPVLLGAKVVLEVSTQLVAHGDDTVSHDLDLTQPLLLEFGRVEDGVDNAGTVDGGVRVHGTDQDLQLGLDACTLLSVGAGDREGTDTLTIETHVLGKRLREHKRVTIADKLAKRIRITVTVTRGEALVGHVKEDKVTTLLSCYA